MTLTARICAALTEYEGLLVTAVDIAVATGEDRRRVGRALARLSRRSEAVRASHTALAGHPRRWRRVYAVTGSVTAATRRGACVVAPPRCLVLGPGVEDVAEPDEVRAADFRPDCTLYNSRL